MTHTVNKFAGIIQRIREKQMSSGDTANVIEQSAPDDSGINFDIDVPEDNKPDDTSANPDIGVDMPKAGGDASDNTGDTDPGYDPIAGVFPDGGQDGDQEGDTATGDETPFDIAPDPLADAIPLYLELLRKSPSDMDALLEFLDGLDPTTTSLKSFLDTNRSALSLLDETLVVDAQKKIRKGKTSETIIANVNEQIADTKEFSDAIQRIGSLGADRGNAWRQLLAALTGGAIIPGSLGGELHIPVGNKSEGEVAIIRPQSYLSWGYMDFGAVNITPESANEYLGSDESSRLTSGSPGEKRVLRGRVVIESLADQLGGAPWFVLVMNTSGDWFTVVMDSEMFRESYDSGQIIVVEPDPGNIPTVGVDSDGNWVAASIWSIAIVDTNTATIDQGTGERQFDAMEIAKLVDGRFIVNGTQQDLSDIGADIKDHRWDGSPEELNDLRASIPTAREKIFGRR